MQCKWRLMLYNRSYYWIRRARTDLLILDELSYMRFNKYESELLFKVISERSERSSTIVTTNLSFSEWTQLFENTTMVAALVDRLTYRSHVLDMSGPSFRLQTAQAENEAATTASNTTGWIFGHSWLRDSLILLYQVAQVFVSISGSNIG